MSKWLKERGLSILDNALYEGVRLLIVALLLTVGYAVYRSIRQQPLQWIVLLVFVALGIIALFLIAISRFRSKNKQSAQTLFESGGVLDGEIYRLVWAKDASTHSRLFLEVQITNNGIPATIVRGYCAHAKLNDGTRLDGKIIAIPIGQQMISGKYKITANKLIYEETTTPIIDGGQAGGWIGFEFPVSLELVRRGDTIITLEFHDAKGNRYFVEAPATGTAGAEMQYHPGTGTRIEEIQETTPRSSSRRFGVRCGTDSYSQNILTGNIPGRYLHAEITDSQAVSACKVYLREIRRGNKLWQGQEQLTFELSEAPDSLSKAVFEKIKYRLDVLLLPSTGGHCRMQSQSYLGALA